MLHRLAATAIVLALAAGGPALAQDVYFDWNKKDPRLPDCGAPAVRSAVHRTIARADPDYRNGLAITDLSRIAETGYRKDRPSPLARRYCRATAQTTEIGSSRPRSHKLFYMIEEYQAFAGMGWNVEVCVLGRDRWYVHDAWCRTVRP